MRLEQYPIAVVILHQPECPACEEAKPLFNEFSRHYRATVPTLFIDVSRPENLPIADALGAKYTPTTLLLHFGGVADRVDHAPSRPKLAHIYAEAHNYALYHAPSRR